MKVTVDIYDNRFVVTSFGPTASRIILNGETDDIVHLIRRNPILVDIFARMKFIDRSGSGFDKIKNGTNSLFKDGNNHVEFRATQAREDLIISLIEENNKITCKELAEHLGVSIRTLQRILNENESIKFVGSGKSGYWKIIK